MLKQVQAKSIGNPSTLAIVCNFSSGTLNFASLVHRWRMNTGEIPREIKTIMLKPIQKITFRQSRKKQQTRSEQI